MKLLRRELCLLAGLVLGPACQSGEIGEAIASHPVETPTAEQLFARSVQAVGGKAAFDRVASLVKFL